MALQSQLATVEVLSDVCKKMKNFTIKFLLILIVLWMPATTENKTVITGRPTLSKVVVGGSIFILTALVAGLSLFCYVYCKYKDLYAEIEEDLLTGRRQFRPQLDDEKKGLLGIGTDKPDSFMRKIKRNKWRKQPEEEGREEGEDREEENKEEDEPHRTRRDRTRHKEPDESQVQGGDLKKPSENQAGIQGKAKGAERRELPKREKINVTRKGEQAGKSEPGKTSRNLKDRTAAEKTVKNPVKKPDGKAKERSLKTKAKTQKIKKEKKIKPKKPKKQKSPKIPKRK
ncbi:uncharacterized protein [Dendropsophus ebraccatus]|uniref:uncharacterized protein isoform X2 n=1 Tax=Dendropsophus ebraccatus TaxID=150705 RepID=UPI00383214D5